MNCIFFQRDDHRLRTRGGRTLRIETKIQTFPVPSDGGGVGLNQFPGHQTQVVREGDRDHPGATKPHLANQEHCHHHHLGCLTHLDYRLFSSSSVVIIIPIVATVTSHQINKSLNLGHKRGQFNPDPWETYWLGPEGIFVKCRGISRELQEFQNYSTPSSTIDPYLPNSRSPLIFG